jgi:hypothetical protein
MSFPELLDVLNERLIAEGSQPITFESDCATVPRRARAARKKKVE